MIVRRLGPLLAGSTIALLTACSGPAPQAAAPALTTTTLAVAALGPAEASAVPPGASAAPSGIGTATQLAPQLAVVTDGGCGSVVAASGLTLSVLDSSQAGIGCAQAHRLIAEFQARIAGQQPAGSGRPVSATVDGWLCVSGPPSSHGGTTCSLDDKTVYARVVANG